MSRSKRIYAALAVACGLALLSCHSGAGAQDKSNPNVKILKRGPNGHATEVRIDGKNWAVCSKKATQHCIDSRPAGLV
jgi:hypothetical protein